MVMVEATRVIRGGASRHVDNYETYRITLDPCQSYLPLDPTRPLQSIRNQLVPGRSAEIR